MYFQPFFLLFFLFLHCQTPPDPKKERRGVVFPIQNIYEDSNLLKKASEFLSHNHEDSPYEVTHRTFAISLYISNSEKDSSKKFQSSFMVDTGSDSTLHKKNYYFQSGKIFSSPVYTANEKYEEKLEVFVRSLYDPSGSFLKKEKLFVTKSLEPLPVDGILGNSFFSNYILYVDYPKILVLYQPTEWDTTNLSEYEEIAAIPDVQTHWIFPISIKGKTYLFLFDTGADYTIYDSELAKNFLYLKDKTIQYMEFSGRLYESKVYFSPEICISPNLCTYNTPGLSSSALSSFLRNNKYKIHGILGMNWIKNYKFALDYTKWKLYLIKR